MDAALLVLKSNNLETAQSKVETSGGKISKAIFLFLKADVSTLSNQVVMNLPFGL